MRRHGPAGASGEPEVLTAAPWNPVPASGFQGHGLGGEEATLSPVRQVLFLLAPGCRLGAAAREQGPCRGSECSAEALSELGWDVQPSPLGRGLVCPGGGQARGSQSTFPPSRSPREDREDVNSARPAHGPRRLIAGQDGTDAQGEALRVGPGERVRASRTACTQPGG